MDWPRFLTAHSIQYQDAGKHNITTSCPFCGSVDTLGHYLAISTRGRGWRCFRNPRQHRGRSNARLIAALLKCSEAHARDLAGETAPPLPSAYTFGAEWRKKLGVASPEGSRPASFHLKLPPEFKSLASHSRFVDAFWNYLYGRGYTFDQAAWAVENYQLHYAITGPYAYRIIVPVYAADGKLMTWTGRSIRPDAEIRYKTLATDDACAPPGDLLLGLQMLWSVKNPRCLVVCEGPFDAIAVTVLGHLNGVYGTCLFGLNVSEAQADLLAELERRFERMRLMLDSDALLRILSLRERLPQRCKSAVLLTGAKDPGELIKKGNAGLSFVRALAG